MERWAHERSLYNPWTNVYGLARSLLALASVATLVSNPADTLLDRGGLVAHGLPCATALERMGLYCLTPPQYLELIRWLSAIGLLVVASGWRPRLTALPHAWISVSLSQAVYLIDGGDQVTSNLTILLLPVALLDPRHWHWSEDRDEPGHRPFAVLTAWSALQIIRLQVAVIYLVSCIAKLGRPEWVDGTAVYYLLVGLRAPDWVVSVLAYSWPATLATWGTLALEFALGIAIVMPISRARHLLPIGVLFHLLIGLLLGLWSFAFAMIAALVLYLRPCEEPFSFPAVRWFRPSLVQCSRIGRARQRPR